MFNSTMRVCLAIVLALVLGIILYSECCSDRVKVFVDIKDGQDPFRAIPELRNGMTQKIEKVEEVNREKGEYEITFRHTRKRKNLLEFILGKDFVERAEIREDIPDRDDDD